MNNLTLFTDHMYFLFCAAYSDPSTIVLLSFQICVIALPESLELGSSSS